MSVWKMRRDEVYKLIDQYKMQKCLWDCKSNEYKRYDMKKYAWIHLAKIFGREVYQIKKKIKYLLCTYAHDKKKIELSLENKFSQPYRSNLFYYKKLEFLDSVAEMKVGQRIKKIGTDPISIVENADCENEPDHNYVSKDFLSAEDTRPSTSSPFVPNECGSKPTQRRKQRKLAPYYSMLSAAVKSLTEDNQSTPPDETIYSAFGKSIALQLTQLSSVEAASTISEIQQLMSKNIITSMMSKERGEQDTKFTLPQTNPVDKGNSHLRTHSNDYYSLTM